jgi:hypothetical protein
LVRLLLVTGRASSLGQALARYPWICDYAPADGVPTLPGECGVQPSEQPLHAP